MTGASRGWRAFAILLALALVLVFGLILNPKCVKDLNAGETDTVEDVAAAIVRIVQPYTAHPVIKDPAFLMELATGIHDAGKANAIPPRFLVGMYFRESSFRINAKGKRKEVGLGQTNGVAYYYCKRYKKFNMKTVAGQAMCGASWLAHLRDQCGGDLASGFAYYASGRGCNVAFVRDTVKDRFDLWKSLESGGGNIKKPRRGV